VNQEADAIDAKELTFATWSGLAPLAAIGLITLLMVLPLLVTRAMRLLKLALFLAGYHEGAAHQRAAARARRSNAQRNAAANPMTSQTGPGIAMS
jgi:hypothetical protein